MLTEFVLGLLLSRALLAQRLFLLPQLFAHSLHARSERGEHRLLVFQSGGPLVDLARRLVVLVLSLKKGLVLLSEPFPPLIELVGLVFEFPRVALEMLEAGIDFQGGLLQLLLPLIESGL